MSEEAIARAAFLLLTMSVAGGVHVLWLRTQLSRRFAWPVDGGIEFRGRRLFGENKRVCGFMVFPPAAALAFMLLGGARDLTPAAFGDGLWALTAWQYAGLGLVSGLAFMLAELPNSFIKRQLGIPPGQSASRSWLRPVILLVDRYDSVLGVLLVLSLLVPVPIATWILVLLLGPVVHAVFSIVMHALGIKARAL
jgi:CDP-2,3-bis-(O-geranylgeranyl)-sn-glycerol synthase